MQRIEAGEVGVSATDLRALLAVYGVRDDGEIEHLAKDARASRRQRWWMGAEYREHLTPALRQLIQFESEAKVIRAYQPALIPGVLQTPAVADFVLDYRGNALAPETRRVRFEVRMRRKRQVLERADGPLYFLVLDESVIKRHIGNAKIMAEQLECLAEAAQRPRIKVRVVPFHLGAFMGIVEPFNILALGDVDDGDSVDHDAFDNADAVVYREMSRRDRISHDLAEIRSARSMFDDLWSEALDEEASLRMIIAEAATLRTRQDLDERR